MRISEQAYFMGRDVSHAAELTPDLRANAFEWRRRYDLLADIYERETGEKAPDRMTSGWRPRSINDQTPGAAKSSKHLTCEAGDLDDNGPFDRWCFEHPEHLAAVGMWQEHPGWTADTPTSRGWCHLQIVPPSLHGVPRPEFRTFIPNMNDPMTLAYGREPVIYRMAA